MLSQLDELAAFSLERAKALQEDPPRVLPEPVSQMDPKFEEVRREAKDRSAGASSSATGGAGGSRDAYALSCVVCTVGGGQAVSGVRCAVRGRCGAQRGDCSGHGSEAQGSHCRRFAPEIEAGTAHCSIVERGGFIGVACSFLCSSCFRRFSNSLRIFLFILEERDRVQGIQTLWRCLSCHRGYGGRRRRGTLCVGRQLQFRISRRSRSSECDRDRDRGRVARQIESSSRVLFHSDSGRGRVSIEDSREQARIDRSGGSLCGLICSGDYTEGCKATCPSSCSSRCFFQFVSICCILCAIDSLFSSSPCSASACCSHFCCCCVVIVAAVSQTDPNREARRFRRCDG